MASPADRLKEALAGRYRLLRKLADGGMATVFLARDLRHDRDVALKVVEPELTGLVNVERFQSEIATMARLSHPHILPLYDSGTVGELLYFVTPYIEGESLQRRLDRDGPLPVPEALAIASQVASGVAHAHTEGVIHRDIKPGNILLHQGNALLADFGIALTMGVKDEDRLTSTGLSIGTPEYMSPEQASGDLEIDHRSDIYSLACVVHEMLAGEPVFLGSTPRAVAAKQVTAPPTPIRTIRPGVPEHVEEALLRALEKSRVDRFASMEEFAEALLEESAQDRASFGAWGTLSGALANTAWAPTAIVLALLAGIGAVSVVILGDSEPLTLPPTSVAVIPVLGPSADPDERELAYGLAEAITRELQGWDSVRVATQADLAGPLSRVESGDSGVERTEDVAYLARAVDTESAIPVTVDIRGDSVLASASIVDPRNGRSVGDPILSRGARRSPPDPALIAPVVAGVLGFGDAPDPDLVLGAGTRSPTAAEEFLHGLESLRRSALSDAEERFRSAVQIDSTFAAALSYLAQTHFWMAEGVNWRLRAAGPEISKWSTAALRHLDNLSPRHAAHVRGFYAFQIGDYPRARELYRSLLDLDPGDAHARLMVAQIEWYDRRMTRRSDGRFAARSSLTGARQALSEVVRIDPTYELAYGHLLRIQERVERALNRNGCPGFDLATDEFHALWESSGGPTPTTRAFCPAVLDSLIWVPMEEFDTLDQRTLRAGATRLFRRTVGELERWASFAPDNPRPREMLSEAFLLERSRAGAVAPERLQEMASEALRHKTEALEIRGDTARTDLVELANLHLAAGQFERAADLAQRAVEDYSAEGSPGLASAPPSLSNVALWVGQLSRALEIFEDISDRWYVRDPETGEMISLAGAETVIRRLQVLAAMGVSGPRYRRELERVTDLWSGAGYSNRQQRLLRQQFTHRIATGLSLDSIALARWMDSLSFEDPEEPALVALSLSQAAPERARSFLLQALRDGVEPRRARDAFVLGKVASTLGLPSEAIRLYSRLDSLPYGVNGFDPGWGLQVTSHLLRADVYLADGDTAAARQQLLRFIEARSRPDSVIETDVREVMARLNNLSEDR